jgi:hypothetical protein
MALFTPAESTSAFLKMGLLGFAGSGKTKTASITAIGLVQFARSRQVDYASRPVFFIDTETGSDWVKPDFDKAGIPLMVAKTRAFVDLLTAVDEAQKGGSLLLIDSVSHFWKELCDSYSKQKARQFKTATYRLQFQDWGYLKGEWGKFTDAFINSPLHIILCGRAGYEYDYFENDEGKKELEKTGVKMKAEGEMGYEPSLLVLMERNQKIESGSVAATWREATVLKDRSTLLDGKVFVDPTFANFKPHIDLLNLGGKQLGVDTRRTSEHAVVVERKDWSGTQRAIVLEEIEAVLVEHYPSTKAEDKQAKAGLILEFFDTRSWTEVTNMSLTDLRTRYDALYQKLKGTPSRYTALLSPQAATTEINDELPEHSAQPTQPTQSLKDKLLAEIATLATMDACLEWAIKTSAEYGDFDGNGAVYAALLKRQALIGSGASLSKLTEATPEGAENPPLSPPPTSRNGSGGRGLNLLEAG